MGHAMLTLETVTAVKDGEEQCVVKVRVWLKIITFYSLVAGIT